MACDAKVIDWKAKLATYYQDCVDAGQEPDHKGIELQAHRDRRAIEHYLRKAPKRKAFPPWGLPAEALLCLLNPEARVDLSKAGVGARTLDIANPTFQNRFDQLLRKIRRTSSAPLSMLRSMAFASGKGQA